MTASSRWRTIVPFLPLVAALVGSLAYWPGLVTWDSLRQYDQALSGAFDDWHPPAMEWIWRQCLGLAHGPAPMLVLQLALYGAGFVLLIRARLAAGRRGWAMLSACCALQPIVIALMATIIKDSLMTGALLCAVGLVMTAERAAGTGRAHAARVGALLLCLFAATLRFNALPAALPVAFWALPSHWRSGWRRGSARCCCACLRRHCGSMRCPPRCRSPSGPCRRTGAAGGGAGRRAPRCWRCRCSRRCRSRTR